MGQLINYSDKFEWYSSRFEAEILDEENHQGNAIVNYTDNDDRNDTLLVEYKQLIFKEENVIMSGRFAEYKYCNTGDSIRLAFDI